MHVIPTVSTCSHTLTTPPFTVARLDGAAPVVHRTGLYFEGGRWSKASEIIALCVRKGITRYQVMCRPFFFSFFSVVWKQVTSILVVALFLVTELYPFLSALDNEVLLAMSADEVVRVRTAGAASSWGRLGSSGGGSGGSGGGVLGSRCGASGATSRPHVFFSSWANLTHWEIIVLYSKKKLK